MKGYGPQIWLWGNAQQLMDDLGRSLHYRQHRRPKGVLYHPLGGLALTLRRTPITRGGP